MGRDILRQKYKYYFMKCEHPNLYTPWTFEGIMGDIQHSLYNGEGLEPWQIESKNLERRISSLDYDKQQIARRELSEAKALGERRISERKLEYETEVETKRKNAEKNYRKAWKEASFFYKITHKRQNPKNIGFDNLSDEEIKRKTSYIK